MTNLEKSNALLTPVMCDNSCCCVIVLQYENQEFIQLADRKDYSLKPLTIYNNYWLQLKNAIKQGQLDFETLNNKPLGFYNYGISVKKIKSHIYITNIKDSSNHTLVYTLREWNSFIVGIKNGDFDDLTLAA